MEKLFQGETISLADVCTEELEVLGQGLELLYEQTQDSLAYELLLILKRQKRPSQGQMLLFGP